MSKILIISGIVLILIGGFSLLCSKLNLPFQLFKLPGDFVFKGENWAFYFPLTSCLLISLVFMLIGFLIRQK